MTIDRNAKEFHDLRGQFEKDVQTYIYGHKIEREGKQSKNFYTDGYVDMLFRLYMQGYVYRKYIDS